MLPSLINRSAKCAVAMSDANLIGEQWKLGTAIRGPSRGIGEAPDGRC
jgi:hypothetical protein